MAKPDRLIVALDNMSTEQIQSLLAGVASPVTLKVNDLLFRRGADGIADLHTQIDGDQNGFMWMFDPKTHDIGNTAINNLRQLHESGMGDKVSLYTMHASGGSDMLSGAVSERDKLGIKTRLLAITVLTTIKENECREIYGTGINETVLQLARLAKKHGADGVVCSPKEAPMLREEMGEDFLIVTPNIRLPGQVIEGDDQNPDRSRTPQEAFNLGSSHIVVGRPITKAEDPQQVIDTIVDDIQ